MDFFYVPWMSSLASEEAFEGNEVTIASVSRPMPVIPKYKLTFFPAKGFTEISRYILVYAGEPFIDNRISYEQSIEKKEGMFPRIIYL